MSKDESTVGGEKWNVWGCEGKLMSHGHGTRLPTALSEVR